MALVYQGFTLEVTPGMLPPVLHVTEYDINMQIDVTFTQRGQPFEIPSGTTANVEGTLAGHPFRKNCTVNGNTVTFILSENMTAYAGRAWTKIVLTKDSWPVSTCGFWLDCDRAGVEAETVIGAPGFEKQIQNAVDNYLEEHPVDVEVDPTLTIEGAAADAKAVGMKLVPFNAAKAGFVPAAGAKANKKYYLAGSGKFEPIPFESTACAALIGILRAGIYEQDVGAAISALADALHVNESSEDEETFQYGQAIAKGSTARTLSGLESFNLTEIRLVVALHSDFQAGAFCMVSTPNAGSPYLGINASAGFYYSNSGSYPGNFTATPADLASFVGDEPKEVRIKWNNQSGWESRKYMSNLKLFFNGYNPSCGFTLFRLAGYDGSTKLFNLVSSGINGELFDTMGGRTYTFDTTNGLSIVEVEEE